QLRVASDGDVGFREPFDAERAERLYERVAVALVRERIVVGELEERLRPDAADLLDLGENLLYGLGAVAWSQSNRRRAELAIERAASLRLNREAVVAGRVEQVEARHWRQRQIERDGACLVTRL